MKVEVSIDGGAPESRELYGRVQRMALSGRVVQSHERSSIQPSLRVSSMKPRYLSPHLEPESSQLVGVVTGAAAVVPFAGRRRRRLLRWRLGDDFEYAAFGVVVRGSPARKSILVCEPPTTEELHEFSITRTLGIVR